MTNERSLNDILESIKDTLGFYKMVEVIKAIVNNIEYYDNEIFCQISVQPTLRKITFRKYNSIDVCNY